MSRPSRRHPLRIQADLDLEIDGEPARLTGEDRSLRLDLPSANPLYDLSSSGASPLIDLAATLAESGLSLEIQDRRGTLLSVGHQKAPSRFGFLIQSDYIAPANLLALVRLALGYGLHRLRKRRW